MILKMVRRELPSSQRGFALVITLSLMVLLTVIAVALLTLSSITLRSASHGHAISVAKSNARLALMLALGELQQTVGPDKAITATSGIVAENPARPNLTGAWRSWDTFRPDESPDYEGEKASRFQGWLVSSTATNRSDPSFVNTAWGEDSVELVGSSSLGGEVDPAARARAGLVPVVREGKREGSYAWHVADESVKARVNSYRDPRQNETLAQKRAMVAGHRPAVALISARDGSALDFLPQDETATDYEDAQKASGKLIDLNQHDLLAGSGSIGKFRNDVTPYSMGLLTNVREGGLKRDLTSILELGNTLPPAFQNQKLYESTHGVTGVSDPNWSVLAGYYNIYKDLTGGDSSPTFFRAPSERIPITNLAPPRNYYPAPVIAKVEMMFTFVVRDAHAGWKNTLSSVDPNMRYMGHLIYTPVVTLHNPYNVNLQFDRLRLSMKNVPVGLAFHINDRPQNVSLVPLNEMFVGNRSEIAFNLEIANWPSPNSSSPSGSITMKPGQTLLCSPYLDPAWQFRDGNDGASSQFFNWQNNLTGSIKAKPGFRGKAVGFDIDWLTPEHLPKSGQQTDNDRGVLGLRLADVVHIEAAVKRPPTSTTERSKFEITAEITSRGRLMQYGGLSFTYANSGTSDVLSELFPQVHRFPKSGGIPASRMYHNNNTALNTHVQARTFAMFSVYARTANGGVYETGLREPAGGALNALHDGRLAGKPFLHHNPAKPVVNVNLINDKPGNHSHEMNFQPLEGEVDDHLEVDAENRTPYLLTHKGNFAKSIKSGSYLELPSGPMQTIADFRRSNALTSSYLPNFVQPVGNSWVSPLMSTGSVVQTDVTSYPLLDHSVLANHALYDSFYFSTFAQNGALDAAASFEAFMANESPLISQAFEPYLPPGVTVEDARSQLFAGGTPTAEAHELAAEFQMVKGAFNVNSTSVEAWKAMLGAMKGAEVPVLWARSAALESAPTSAVPITAMSLHNAGPTHQGGSSADIDDSRTAEWNGFRELNESEIAKLAVAIVDQVRERGPFLTMSEFVNRQVGPESDLTRMGALQQAIEEAGINDEMFATQTPIEESHLNDPRLYGYQTPAAAGGNPAAGAPSWISQGDLLRVLEPAATVRSDTFVIRVCGEATNAAGEVQARVFAEAVVQRLPEYVDPVDRPSINVYDQSESLVNERFGRRINVVAFRWLSDNEI